MGSFNYSMSPVGSTPDSIDAKIREVVKDLWGQQYRVERVVDVPTTPEDDRVAMWYLFWFNIRTDCASSISMLKDGHLEFKVPRSQYDRWYDDQQKVRRRIRRRRLAKEGRELKGLMERGEFDPKTWNWCLEIEEWRQPTDGHFKYTVYVMGEGAEQLYCKWDQPGSEEEIRTMLKDEFGIEKTL